MLETMLNNIIVEMKLKHVGFKNAFVVSSVGRLGSVTMA